MPQTNINWTALSATEIAATLKNRSVPPQSPDTPFLDCHQWIPLSKQLGWIASGGFTQAQMRCVHPIEHPPAIQYWQFEALNLPVHSRTARGLRRQLRHEVEAGSVGDVIQMAESIALAAMPSAALSLIAAGGQQLPERPDLRLALQRATVASMRLDAICAAIFHISREEAQTAIEYGFLFINFTENTKQSSSIKNGDILVFRNKGKAEIAGCELNPRSTRYWLDYSVNLI